MFLSNSLMLAPMVHKLAKHSLLTSVETEALLSLPYRVESKSVGGYLVREGDKPDKCVLLLSGFIYRSKVTGGGSRQILSIHVRGDLVGLENSLLDEADHNIQALTRVEIAYIPHKAIVDTAEAYPAIAQALWRDTLVDGSVFREWLLNLGRRDARQRISHLFCELALRQEAAGICEGPRYDWPMTQEQIGDATGLTSVHVNRTLQTMRSDGLISSGNHSVTITDWQGLQEAGDFRRAYLHQAAAPATGPFSRTARGTC